MSNKASLPSAIEGGGATPYAKPKTVTPAPMLSLGGGGSSSSTTTNSVSSKLSPQNGPVPFSDVMRRSGITPTASPTDCRSPTVPSPPAVPSSRASTAAGTPLLKRESSSRTAAAPPPPPPLSTPLPNAAATNTVKVSAAAGPPPASSAGAAVSTARSPVQLPQPSQSRPLPPPPSLLPSRQTSAASVLTRDESLIDDRGWEPVMDGRFRVALMHHFAEDIDEGERLTGKNHNSHHHNSICNGPKSHASPFANAVPEELSPEAAAQCEEEARRTPTNDAFCNTYYPGEPCIEVDVEASLVNAINSAYTSTGYPFVVTAGNTRGAVYGSFVDTTNPSLSSLELPPAQSYIIAPSYMGGQPVSHSLTEMDTLLAVQWGRGDRMMTTAGSVAAAAVAASQGKSGNVGSYTSSAVKDGKASAGAGSVPPPSSAGPAGAPHSPAVARTIAHHLAQYPEGIHGIHTSMNLRRILVDGKLPTEASFAPSAPLFSVAAAPLAVPGGNVIFPPGGASTGGGGGGGATSNTPNTDDAATAGAGAGGGNAAASSPAAALPTNAEANGPPLPRPSESNAPVQHTLVSASTFNHLSIYVVAHQDGKVLYTAALQSLSASIATRKVTAHQLFLVGREEVNALPATDTLAPVTVKPPRRTKVAFANVPVSGGEAAVFFQSKTSHFVGADAARRTIAAVPVRFTVEPHLLFGNQNGDIFIFSFLQERIVQHINFNAGSQLVSPAIASGNSGVGSKLICSPVSSIVEVQNGIEKKITSMIEYATVAKRNRRLSFESDDVPSSFTPTGASEPSHYYYPVPPSLYAVGFDNGQMLLLCVTCEGGWMLRHFSSQYFGLRPIHSIAVRVPPFYTRLWTSCLPAITKGEAQTPITALVTPEQTLIVHEEDQHMAAVACNGGVIALVRLPGMEIISSVAPTDYNAVGEILALQWTSTATRYLLTPDVLVASGEDDTMTAFQLLSPSMASAVESSYHPPNNSNNNGVETVSHLSSNESILAGGRLRILEKKKFHRSWVNRLNLFPIVLPATDNAATSPHRSSAGRASSSAKRVACATGGGMPQYLGVCLIATSYDRRTSFWPYIFAVGEDLGEDGNARRSMNESLTTSPPLGGDATDFGAGSSRLSHPRNNISNGGGSEGALLNLNPLSSIVAAPDHYVLIDGPTAAYPLHTELVVSVAAAGGGTSFFLTTVCCRGKVKFWSMKVKV